MRDALVFLLWVLTCLTPLCESSFDIDLDRKPNPLQHHRGKRTDKWTVELQEGADPDEIASRHGFINLGKLPFDAGNHFIFKLPDKKKFLHLHHAREVLWAENQVARWRYKREQPFIFDTAAHEAHEKRLANLTVSFPTPAKNFSSYPDPLFPQQWHLHSTPGVDLNVLEVWKQNITGRGVTIAVIDDGIDGTHPDLKDNYDAASSFDFNGNKAVPEPMPKDHFNSHGTSAGAVAAAGINSYCGIGIAPGAKVSGIRMVAAPVTDHDEALAMTFKNQKNFIFTSSWGPSDDGNRLEGPSRLAALAIKDSIRTGRSGLGTIFIWAVGNGGLRGDNCNYDGFASNRFALSIGSINHHGSHAEYSEPCAALDAVTPSSGHARGITTTTLKELDGGCTARFGGTSASSPLAAGVVALILEANPSLTWRDVQGVIHVSASLVDDFDSDWMVNGAGLHVNHKYGFGLLNAGRAVAVARKWKNYPSESPPVDSGPLIHKSEIPLDSGLLFSHAVHTSMQVLHAEVIITCTVAHRGKVQIRLISPSNTVSLLNAFHGDRNADINEWKYTSKRYWHENAKGVWRLEVTNSGSSSLTLNSWRLKLYGHVPDHITRL